MSQAEEKKPEILESAEEYFADMVSIAFEERNMDAKPVAKTYLTQLLKHYLVSENLFQKDSEEGRTETMAEKFLKALNAEPSARWDLLKRLGDTALYVSGFFGDSFKRKIIDIDYYVEIGGAAYGSLAGEESSSLHGPIYEDLSIRFVDYVDILTVISQKSFVQTNDDLLRLYDRYLSTGSKLAEAQLEQNGMLNASLGKVKQ